MDLAAIGAFLSGVGSVIGGYFALRAVRKRDLEDCERRIQEIREAYDRGLHRGLHIEET